MNGIGSYLQFLFFLMSAQDDAAHNEQGRPPSFDKQDREFKLDKV
jgi:hypothetical protein